MKTNAFRAFTSKLRKIRRQRMLKTAMLKLRAANASAKCYDFEEKINEFDAIYMVLTSNFQKYVYNHHVTVSVF